MPFISSAISADSLTVRRRKCGDHVEITWRSFARVRARANRSRSRIHDPADHRMLLCLEAAPGDGRREHRRGTAAEASLHTKWVMTLSAWSGEACREKGRITAVGS